MDLRLLKLSLLIPLFIACQAGSEIIRPDIDDDGDEGFACTLSSEKIEYGHAYDYESFSLDVAVGEDAVLVDMSAAPWLEVEGNVDLLYPDSHTTLNIVPKEPNYSCDVRNCIVVLKGKYTGKSLEIPVTQVGSSQEVADSEVNTWSMTSDLVSSEDWLTSGIMYANQDDRNGILSLEHSVNSPFVILEDEGRATFKGMQIGDAILMRIPVKKVKPGIGVYAMVNLSQKTSGIKTEWVAEYWEGGVWNSKGTFATSKEESDFSYTVCTCEFTVAEPIENDYIKVRFRKISGSEVVTNFIAAAPLAGAQMKLTVPKEPLVLILDFASWPFNPVISGTNRIKTKDTYTYAVNDVEYPFEIYAPKSGYYYTGSALRFDSTGGGYLKLPAIEGRTLTKLDIGITNGSGKGFILYADEERTETVLNAMNDKNVQGSQAKIPSKGNKEYELTGTAENHSYYLYSADNNIQIGKIIMTYE